MTSEKNMKRNDMPPSQSRMSISGGYFNWISLRIHF